MNQSSVTRLAKIRSQHDSMRKKKRKSRSHGMKPSLSLHRKGKLLKDILVRT